MDFSFIFTFITGLISFVWLIPLIIMSLCKIHLFQIIRDKYKIDITLKNLNNTKIFSNITFTNGKEYKSGLLIDWKYMAYVSDESIYILSTRQIYETLSNEKHIDRKTELNTKFAKKITLFYRFGEYTNLNYYRRKIEVNWLEQRIKQLNIVNDIKQKYINNKPISIFVQGKPGSGKTTLGVLLASQLNGVLCKTFNPTEPGDSLILSHMYLNESDGPLIILLDEVDIIIEKIHEQKINLHKSVHTDVYDKKTFNRFLDDLFLFDRVILVMTSNKSKEELNKLDNSYLREGRVNLYYTL